MAHAAYTSRRHYFDFGADDLFGGCQKARLKTKSSTCGKGIPCHYTLTDSFLLIGCGFLNEEIKYEKIKSASLSSNPLSAPALSLSRVKVDLENGFRLISPQNREAFIAELENKRKPQR
jgi:hypothetical protein